MGVIIVGKGRGGIADMMGDGGWDPNLNQLRSRHQLLCTTVSH